jgi:hypothetical protein
MGTIEGLDGGTRVPTVRPWASAWLKTLRLTSLSLVFGRPLAPAA